MTPKNIQITNWRSGEVMFECPALDDQKPVPLLAEADLDGAKFTGAAFAGATFVGADFTGADLTGADFTWADFTRADFARADFAGADFAGADFAGADFTGANFDGAQFGYEEADTFTQQVLGLPWVVLLSCHEMQIGCERHTLDEWAAFDDRRIAEMGGLPAIRFWRKYKTGLLALAAACSPATDTTEETQ